jgi:redox-sensitive bicupin YhaK (pirin superfamily)
MSLIFRGLAVLAVVILGLSAGLTRTMELDPAALSYRLPDQIKWRTPFGIAPGIESSVLAGDPTQPGLYVIMVRWIAGNHFSRPHIHAHDRFITVLKGTWWVGTGKKFDPDGTVPMPAGAFVTHYGGQAHFDGAKDEDALLLITGEGPDTPTPAEEK